MYTFKVLFNNLLRPYTFYVVLLKVNNVFCFNQIIIFYYCINSDHWFYIMCYNSENMVSLYSRYNVHLFCMINY